MLEVDLAFRHSVTAHLSNLHDEIDSYFDKLEEEMRRSENMSCDTHPENATSLGAANQHDLQDNIGQPARDPVLGWECLLTEKVPTPPLRIQKRSIRWA